MKVDAPLLPLNNVDLPRLKPTNIKVPKYHSEMLEDIKDDVLPYGVRAGRRRFFDRMDEMLDLTNRRLRASLRTKNLQFVKHEASGRYMIILVDQRTGQVLKEYPPEKLLDNAAILKETGLLKSIVG